MYIPIRARKCRFLRTKSRPKPEFLPLVCFAIRCYFVINVRSCTPMSLLGWLLRLFQINHKSFKSQWLIENILQNLFYVHNFNSFFTYFFQMHAHFLCCIVRSMGKNIFFKFRFAFRFCCNFIYVFHSVHLFFLRFRPVNAGSSSSFLFFVLFRHLPGSYAL